MKKLKFSGKLNLNKETVAKLTEDQMKNISGGYPILGIPSNIENLGGTMEWAVGTSGRNTCNCEGMNCGGNVAGPSGGDATVAVGNGAAVKK
ncbi:hypothetical protein FIA58_005115 [Flavobacterium jejuense]|uniref:Bacteriocin-type signal sequence n=1 Tax=Flavobacterium jejuense TaxID=1544455 RepID=A0ABX0IN86_9FLAO|nr:class I lanthipeptide [Flavobacterium jejuense]NHN25053.1 hypothetical protein [Flavobacterium jejuense]